MLFSKHGPIHLHELPKLLSLCLPRPSPVPPLVKILHPLSQSTITSTREPFPVLLKQTNLPLLWATVHCTLLNIYHGLTLEISARRVCMCLLLENTPHPTPFSYCLREGSYARGKGRFRREFIFKRLPMCALQVQLICSSVPWSLRGKLLVSDENLKERFQLDHFWWMC